MIKITSEDIKLAKGIAGNFCRRWGGWANEDIEGYALIGLMKAAKTFDGRGTFRGWLALKVRQVIVDHFRHDEVDLRHYSKPEFKNYYEDIKEPTDFNINKHTYHFDSSHTSHHWLTYYSNDGLEKRLCAKDFIEKAINHLTNSEKKIFLLWLEDKNSREIAEKIHMKVTSIWVRKSNIRKKLRDIWNAL